MTTFQPVSPADIDTVVRLMNDFYAIDQYPFDAAVSTELFRQFIKNEALGKAWLIYHNAEPAGYVILTFFFSFEYQGMAAFLDELYLTKAARGKGIGKEAVSFILDQARQRNVKTVYVETEPHNERARQLYLQQGMQEHHRRLMVCKIKK